MALESGFSAELSAQASAPWEPWCRRIVACVGPGAESDHALAAAAGLADRLGAKLELVHAVAVPQFLSAARDRLLAQRAVEESTRLAGHGLRERLARELGGLRAHGRPLLEALRVRAGPPPKVVLEAARELQADLIVLGASGKRRQLDFGGTARAVLSQAGCAVWQQVQPPRPIRRILAPVDLSPHSLAALRRVIELAGAIGASVSGLHCLPLSIPSSAGGEHAAFALEPFDLDGLRHLSQRRFEEEMAHLDWDCVPHETLFVEDDPARRILARQDDWDLIALATHGRTGLAATLLGSVTWRVMREARTPVLALR